MEKTNTLIKETESEKSNTLYIFNGVDDFESFNEVKNYRVFRKKVYVCSAKNSPNLPRLQ